MTRFPAFALSTLVAVSAFASQDLQLFFDARHAYLVDPGTTATLIINARNKGTDAAQNVTLHMPFPPGTKLLSFQTPQGWTCDAGDSGAVCSTPAVAPNDLTSPSISFIANVVLSSDPNGYSWYDIATITSTTPDDFPPNNSTQMTSITYRMLRVTSADDSGPGTLRAGIDEANARCAGDVPCKMTLDLPANSTIAPLTPLPPIHAGSLRIDGNRTRDGDRLVELSGANLTSGIGLDIRSAGQGPTPLFIEIFGLAINSFPDYGVAITDSGNAAVELDGLFVGTDVSGTIARPNGRGIGIDAPHVDLTMRQNIISGNTHSGIFSWKSGDVWLSNSLIGVGADGRALGNGNSGVFEFSGSMDIANCTIANNGQFGVSIEPQVPRASISANIFANGILGIDWGLDGRGSGPIPPPAITDAVYDAAANETVISGTVAASPSWPLMYVNVFASHARNIAGAAEGERSVAGVTPRQSEFTTRAKGDLRGEIITATFSVGPYLDSVPQLTSEFSEGVVAH